MTSLADILAERNRERPSPPTETARICALPTVHYEATCGDAPAWLEASGELTLRPVQVAALMAIRETSGALLPIGVGHGKSWIAVLAATALDRELAIIMAPAGTMSQLRETHAQLSEHFDVRPAVFVTYSELSRPDGTRMLTELLRRHDLEASSVALVLDEAHKIRNATAARTMRVIWFAVAHPELAIVAMSGTLTSKCIEDMGHLAEMALRDQSPVPRDRRERELWGRCLDVDGQAGRGDWLRLEPLARWAGSTLEASRGQERQAIARAAFHKRLEAAPGVVATRDASVSCALYLAMHEAADDTSEAELDALLLAAGEGVHPSGEFMVDDLEAHRVKRQLSLGFWYQWVWPDDQPDDAWLESRRAWGRYVRRELETHAREGYDSPALVYAKVEREYEQGRRAAVHMAWRAWSLERHKAPPPTVARWVSGDVVTAAVPWAHFYQGIVWYQSAAVASVLRAHGLTTYEAGDEIPRHRHACAMSIRAHGTGLNLQAWDRALVLEPPSSGSTWEQLLGRLHRQGQEADEVIWEVLAHRPVLRAALRTAREQATYIQGTTGQAQKLLLSSPLQVPPVFIGGGLRPTTTNKQRQE